MRQTENDHLLYILEGKQPNKYQDLLTYVLFVIACCTATVALVVFSIFSQTLFTEFMSSVVLRRTKKERVMNAAKSLQSVGGSVVKVGHALFCTCNNARNPMDY